MRSRSRPTLREQRRVDISVEGALEGETSRDAKRCHRRASLHANDAIGVNGRALRQDVV